MSPGAWTYRGISPPSSPPAAGREIAPIVAERLPLEAAARADEHLEHGAVEGKLVLVTASDLATGPRSDLTGRSAPG